jgi:methionyl-tRNA formyltransferase
VRIVFAGTPRFAAVALEAILDAGHTVPLVLTQPDRPAGRGLKPRASAVSSLADSRGLPLLSPRSLRQSPGDADARAGQSAHVSSPASAPVSAPLSALHSAAPDLLVVAAYGLILPQAVLDVPRGIAGRSGVARAINIHASLLPRWRGAAPIARAIEAGDTETGITLMQMDAGLDTGPILHREPIPIEAADTTGTLTERLGDLGARLIVSWLREAPQGLWQAAAQPAVGVTTAPKIGRNEAWLDWREPAAVLARRVRAFDPEPGACGRLGDGLVKIWSAQAIAQPPTAEPGTVLAADAAGVGVACGVGVLLIRELQRAGGRRLRAREYLAGAPIAPGARWQLPQT